MDDARKRKLEETRKESKRAYLEKREEEQKYIFSQLVQDEERIFKGSHISSWEQSRHLARQNVDKIVQEKLKLNNEVNLDVYSSGISTAVKEDDVSPSLLYNPALLKSEREMVKIETRADSAPPSSIDSARRQLPVFKYKESLLSAVTTFQVIVVVGETGSGKTTQIPQYLMEAGMVGMGKMIGCTQPRRVAAMSVASRVATEMNCKLGSKVGYCIRFEDVTSPKTVLKYMTDGMLLREFVTEPDLGSYDYIIIDEAHERTLHTDILLGLLKDILRFRKDLHVIVSSATIDATKFSVFFDNAPIFTIPGRRFDVDIYYTKQPEPDYLSAALKTIMQIHLSQLSGDILVFLTGQEEIELVEENLTQVAARLPKGVRELIIAPIYANLPVEQQNKIFLTTPVNSRKVVLATNIAETSITIDGIMFVIDPGYVKQSSFDPRTATDSLKVVPCSRASANQRAGRAGRLAPGKCFRLFTSWAFQHEMDENSVPEIRRTNLCSVVLILKSLGIDDILSFDFLEAPESECLIGALEQLYALGALDCTGEITKLGRKMAEVPVDPRMAAAIFAAEALGSVNPVLTIASMLELQGSLFSYPRHQKALAEKQHLLLFAPEGDHITMLNIWKKWEESGFSTQWCRQNFLQQRSLQRARDIRGQLLGVLERLDCTIPDTDDTMLIRKALLAGFFSSVAYRRKNSEAYSIINSSRTAFIHPSSSLSRSFPHVILYSELILTSKNYLRHVSEIDPKWIPEILPYKF